MAFVFHSLVDDANEWRTELKALIPDLDYRVWPDVGNPTEIDIALIWKAPPGMLAQLPNVELLLSLGAGVDHFLTDPDLPENVPITRLIDDFCATAMMEYVLLQVLRFHRNDPIYQNQQSNKEWIFHAPKIAADRTVGIMGLGALGSESAKTLKAVGFNVRSWTKHKRNIDGVESFSGINELPAFLSKTDILICLLALTEETSGVLNKHNLSRLPKGAYVINVARGDHLVEHDLLSLLDSGWLAGAALDCFTEEPLPDSNPIWSHPKIFLTPHASTGTNAPSAARHVAENIRRFYAKEPLLNELNRDTGY